MSIVKILLSSLVLAVAAAYVLARPHKEFVLADVANKTMCPIEVEINDVPNRIPRRIKFLKCASSPNRLCLEQHVTHGCCKRHHRAYVSECVEIYDWVQVTHRGSDAPHSVKVPVGCTCLLVHATHATEVS